MCTVLFHCVVHSVPRGAFHWKSATERFKDKHMSKRKCRKLPLKCPLVPNNSLNKMVTPQAESRCYGSGSTWYALILVAGSGSRWANGKNEKVKKCIVVKCWMFSFEYKHLVSLGRPSWESGDFWREKNVQPYNFTLQVWVHKFPNLETNDLNPRWPKKPDSHADPHCLQCFIQD